MKRWNGNGEHSCCPRSGCRMRSSTEQLRLAEMNRSPATEYTYFTQYLLLQPFAFVDHFFVRSIYTIQSYICFFKPLNTVLCFTMHEDKSLTENIINQKDWYLWFWPWCYELVLSYCPQIIRWSTDERGTYSTRFTSCLKWATGKGMWEGPHRECFCTWPRILCYSCRLNTD